MEFFKVVRKAIKEEGGLNVAKLIGKAVASAFLGLVKEDARLISRGIPMGIGITLGAAIVWSVAVRLATL